MKALANVFAVTLCVASAAVAKAAVTSVVLVKEIAALLEKAAKEAD
jgi:hypothetical protein